jgi:probable HAF family extracellular repeat protein
MNATHFAKACGLMLVAALFAGPGFIPHAAAQERAYFIDLNTRTATELGSLGGGHTLPRALNDAGQVVGASSITSGGASHAFITGPNGKGMRDLGTLGGSYSHAVDINDAGQVVGYNNSSTGASHAFITAANGMNMQNLFTLSKAGSSADGINDAGQVVGSFAEHNGFPEGEHAFITGPNGEGMMDIAGVGWGFIRPSSINATGQVAGSAGDPPDRPFITGENGVGIRDIAGLPNHPYVAHATAINDAGRVAGGYLTDANVPRSYVTGPDGVGITELATLGGDWNFALGINNAGQVVGDSDILGGGASHAFITGPNGEGMTDLNSLVDLPDGVGVIPEPETYAMFLAGLVLIGFMSRPKRLLVRRALETIAVAGWRYVEPSAVVPLLFCCLLLRTPAKLRSGLRTITVLQMHLCAG